MRGGGLWQIDIPSQTRESSPVRSPMAQESRRLRLSESSDEGIVIADRRNLVASRLPLDALDSGEEGGGDNVELAPAPPRGRGRPRTRPQPANPPAKRPRGRPPKATVAQEEAALVADAPVGGPLAPLRVVGNDVLTRVSACVSAPKNYEEPNPKVVNVCSYVMGPTNRSALPLICDAKQCGMGRREYKQLSMDMGAFAFAANTAFFCRFALHLLRKIELEELDPIALVFQTSYDETPLPIGIRSNNMSKQQSGLPARGCSRQIAMWKQSQAGKQSQLIGGRLDQVASAKIVQSDAKLVALCRHKASGRLLVFEHAIPQPLRIVESCSGSALAECLRRSADIPFLRTLWDKFGFSAFVTVSDNGSSNNLAERGIEFLVLPFLHFIHMKCRIHKLHTVTGRTLKPFDEIVGGMVALALATKAGGAARLRQAIETVLKDSVELVPNGIPPALGSAAGVFREHLFDLCLPLHKLGSESRRVLLRSLFNGNLQSDRIDVYYPAGDWTEETWAREAANALLPCNLDVFPRHRWLSSVTIVNQILLLAGVHNVLKRAVLLWLGRDADANTLAPAIADAPRAADPAAASSSLRMSSEYWAEFNKKQKRSALSFGRSIRLPSLVILRVCVEPLTALLRLVLKLRTPEWEESQLDRAAAGLQRDYPVLAMASGSLAAGFFADIERLMFEQDSWHLVGMLGPTSLDASAAFAALCSAAGGLHFYWQREHSRYPWRLFLLLRSEGRDWLAQNILADPPCLRCSFTRSFLKKYCSISKLTSQDSILTLVLLAATLQLDTADIECRHAWIRRHLIAKSTTWSAEVSRISSDFLLMRYRQLVRTHWSGNTDDGKTSPAIVQRLSGPCKLVGR